jgi:hypothetical protein
MGMTPGVEQLRFLWFWFVLGCVIFIGSSYFDAQSSATIPSGWVASMVPPEKSEAAVCANWAEEEWTVALSSSGSSLQIARNPPSRATQSIDLPDGRLVGENRGEFGGEVWWEPRSGGRQSIARTNPVAFVQVGGVVYGLVGLAHMFSDAGSLVRFERRSDGSWQMTTTLDLGSAPHAAFAAADGTLFVVLTGALARVTPPNQLTVLHRNPVWRLTYPTSIVRDQIGTLYVGMRSAVARLSPRRSGLFEDWLVPSNCIQRRQSPSRLPPCHCVQ